MSLESAVNLSRTCEYVTYMHVGHTLRRPPNILPCSVRKHTDSKTELLSIHDPSLHLITNKGEEISNSTASDLSDIRIEGYILRSEGRGTIGRVVHTPHVCGTLCSRVDTHVWFVWNVYTQSLRIHKLVTETYAETHVSPRCTRHPLLTRVHVRTHTNTSLSTYTYVCILLYTPDLSNVSFLST